MSATDPFQIPWHTHVLSSAVIRLPGLWKWLGNLETTLLEDELKPVAIDRPVYVAGLARSGSTILLEAIASQPGVVTHQYRDFPGIFTPYWWNGGQECNHRNASAPQERAHRDGLFVTPDSPEAMEEMLWMAFFRDLHNPQVSNVLGAEVANAAFEKFYADHIRKLLLVRGGERYACKENYNITRLEYLLKLFPDARVVVPIRHPVQHVASLMKQHRLFCEGEERCPRALEHMRRVGHFEFGLDLRLINVGNDSTISEIESLFDQGEAARGWARYWASVYGFLADQLDSIPNLRQAVLVVRYERLCESPQQTLSILAEHCKLIDAAVLDEFSTRIQAPDYYRTGFTTAEIDAILQETSETTTRFEYAITG